MAYQDRTNAVQGEYVRLYRTFVLNGNLFRIPENSLPNVDIVDETGAVLDTLPAQEDRIGLYYVQWLVPVDLEPGKYYDRWNYQYDENGEVFEETTYFEVGLADTFMSFSGSNISVEITEKVAQLLRALINDFIYEAQHIPLYWEQGIRTADSTRYDFAFKNWLEDPKPLVRKNGRLMKDGWVVDYDKGQLFFQNAPDETDDISVSYNFAYFSVDELSSFLNAGLMAMNALPPSTWNYTNLQWIPRHWDYGVLLMAAIHALRRLVMGLNFQERSIIFGEDPDRARAVQQQFQQLYQDYSALWTDISDGIKKALPATAMVVVPEYTLPGGRSRWFRYLYTTQGGS